MLNFELIRFEVSCMTGLSVVLFLSLSFCPNLPANGQTALSRSAAQIYLFLYFTFAHLEFFVYANLDSFHSITFIALKLVHLALMIIFRLQCVLTVHALYD